MRFSDELETHLRSIGWSPGRCVDVDRLLQPLREMGISIVPDAVRIVREFGGMSIVPWSPRLERPCGEPVLFVPNEAAITIPSSILDYWEERLGTKLTPIAEIGGIATELVSAEGKIYFSFQTGLNLDGVNFEDAAENRLLTIRRDSLETIGDMLDDPAVWKDILSRKGID